MLAPIEASSVEKPGIGTALDMSLDDDKPAPFEKKTGFAHLFAATRYSMQGARRLWREAAFRHEVLAFGVGLLLLALRGAAPVYYLGFLLLMLVLFSVEALNTAIEDVIDRISPEFSIVARNAKDLGSFAVFCLLVANGLYIGWVMLFAG
ncbi:diacylglycerol kinase [Agrobacterium vitis]|nr:diacylglycerol kinase [Allorhizobium ampelinum]MVA51351.1 diacylglycerol kinase [Agrobacterium vitis]MVA69997.1 diacylglycerol kinase [Agrobacterium vitis]